MAEEVKTKQEPYLKNAFCFGIGTIGRDMLYTLVSMYLLFYFTDIVNISDFALAWLTGLMVFFRIFDAVNDPFMGTLVDNTRSKWGKFKPWIAIGAFLSGIITVLMFADFGLDGMGLVILFAFLYLLWDFTYSMNDIAYWSMVPALSANQKQRENIGAIARICANIGLFIVAAGVIPITKGLGAAFGGDTRLGYFLFAILICAVLWIGQAVTVFGVKERVRINKIEHTSLKEMFKVIFKNDQLLIIAASMVLFMIGYVTTTSFGQYYFKYVFKNEDLYSVFAIVLGVAQLSALAVFPIFSKFFTRKKLYTIAIILVVVGYLFFFFSPVNIILVGISALFLFFGQAFMQLLMLVFLADTVEYGEWKMKKRNESVSFSVQPFINKFAGAIASGIVGITLIITGINESTDPAAVSEGSLWMMKVAMLIIPMFFVAAGFIIYFLKYRIDKKRYDEILADLEVMRAEQSAEPTVIAADGAKTDAPAAKDD